MKLNWWGRAWKIIGSQLESQRERIHAARQDRMMHGVFNAWRSTTCNEARLETVSTYLNELVCQAVENYEAKMEDRKEHMHRMLRSTAVYEDPEPLTQQMSVEELTRVESKDEDATRVSDLRHVREARGQLQACVERTIYDKPGLPSGGGSHGDAGQMGRVLQAARWVATENALRRMIRERGHGSKRWSKQRTADIGIIVRYELGLDLEVSHQVVGASVALRTLSALSCKQVLRRWAKATRTPTPRVEPHHARMVRGGRRSGYDSAHPR